MLVIEDPSLVLPTILSRCQLITVPRCSFEDWLETLDSALREEPSLKQAWILGGECPLSASSWLAKQSLVQSWVEGYLANASKPELKAEQVNDYCRVIHQVLRDYASLILAKPNTLCFKNFEALLMKNLPTMNLLKISELQQALCETQALIHHHHVNAKWALRPI